MSDSTPPAVIITTGEIVGPGLPDPLLTQQLLDHVFGLLEAGSTNVATALEAGLTELDTIDRLLVSVEAVRTAARAFCARVMTYANLASTMTTDRTLTLIPDGETESFDAAKLKGLITDMVGNGGRDAEIAGLIAQCRKKGHRAGYLMIKARKGE
jgi:hypothetical protein